MDELILELGKKFLVSYLKGKTISYESYHPWRKGWEFVVLHSLRVEGYVKKILSSESHDLTQDEIILTRLAAILHDIGRIHQREDHARLGRDIVYDWLTKNQSVCKDIKEQDRLLYIIEKHSNKDEVVSDYCLRVVRDADVLDEIGILSIFMASNWIDRSNPYYFKLFSDRVENYEIGFCDKEYKRLNTETAKTILDKKREFILLFSDQLKDELYGTEMFGEAKIENYFEEKSEEK